MKMMVDYAHDFLKEVLTKDSIAVDFTMGNGLDCEFLCRHCKEVYAFDIQKEALERTTKRLEDANLHNAKLILDGHENAPQYIPYYHVGIFNLGYLPLKDHIVTTKMETTMLAIKHAIDYLHRSGRLIIVVYPGHDEGKRESEAIDRFVTHMSSHDYHVAKMSMENKKMSPYLYIIDKVY